jgi:hypothetical protein
MENKITFYNWRFLPKQINPVFVTHKRGGGWGVGWWVSVTTTIKKKQNFTFTGCIINEM